MSKYTFEDYLVEKRYYDAANGKVFIIEIRDEKDYYFIKTRDNDFQVYHYNKERKELLETGKTFNEHILNLIKKYNPELEELEGISVSGDIVNI